jgi:hypothetical protein
MDGFPLAAASAISKRGGMPQQVGGNYYSQTFLASPPLR